MTDFPRFHQTPGCVLLSGRHYAFHRPTGTQIVDQPRQGFSTRAEGLIWLKRIADDTMNPEIYSRTRLIIIAPAEAAVDTAGNPIRRSQAPSSVQHECRVNPSDGNTYRIGTFHGPEFGTIDEVRRFAPPVQLTGAFYTITDIFGGHETEISLEEWESWAKVEETEMCYRCGTRKPLDELECVYDNPEVRAQIERAKTIAFNQTMRLAQE